MPDADYYDFYNDLAQVRELEVQATKKRKVGDPEELAEMQTQVNK